MHNILFVLLFNNHTEAVASNQHQHLIFFLQKHVKNNRNKEMQKMIVFVGIERGRVRFLSCYTSVPPGGDREMGKKRGEGLR